MTKSNILSLLICLFFITFLFGTVPVFKIIFDIEFEMFSRNSLISFFCNLFSICLIGIIIGIWNSTLKGASNQNELIKIKRNFILITGVLLLLFNIVMGYIGYTVQNLWVSILLVSLGISCFKNFKTITYFEGFMYSLSNGFLAVILYSFLNLIYATISGLSLNGQNIAIDFMNSVLGKVPEFISNYMVGGFFTILFSLIFPLFFIKSIKRNNSVLDYPNDLH